MTANFRRWEVDPFFAAAEDVQDSADRLESAYRTWIYLKGLVDDPDAASSVDLRRRELGTALGAAKWQLEEFERAVSQAAFTEKVYVGEDAPARHKQFVEAIRSQISSVENGLLCSEQKIVLKVLPPVNLHNEDKHDLALFLSGTRLLESSVDKDGSTESSIDKDASTTVFDEETKEEVPSTSSESRESKGWASSKHMLPAWSMDRICNMAELRISDSQSSSGNLACESKNLNAICLQGRELLGNLDNGFVDPRSELGDRSIIQHLPEGKYANGNDKCKGNAVGRMNGQCRSASVGSDLNSWKVGRLVKTTREKVSESWRTEGLANGLTSWAFFNKKKPPVELKVSRSGFKRWKDGDVDLKDCKRISSYFRCNGRPRDVEMGLSNNCFGGSMKFFRGCATGSIVNGEEKQLNGWSEAFQRGLQRTQCSLYMIRPVHLASAILLVLGVIGLLSFRATGAL